MRIITRLTELLPPNTHQIEIEGLRITLKSIISPLTRVGKCSIVMRRLVLALLSFVENEHERIEESEQTEVI